MNRLPILAAVACLAAPLPSLATDGMHQDMQHMHDQMQGKMHDMQNMSEADKDLMMSMNSMHQGMMSLKLTGDADIDFAQRMLMHHQGAVSMANIVLKYGKDPEIKKLAEGIIKSQEGEIAFMKSWLETHKKSATP